MQRPLHFLVVDDDAFKRELMVNSIHTEFSNASIYECHSGKEALDFFERNPVDVVITDHSMHPINGVELVTAIRKRGSSVPIIMVSAYEAIRPEAEAAGVNLFLSCYWHVLGREIAEFLRQLGRRDETEE